VVTNAPAGATSSCLPATPVSLLAADGTIDCPVTFTPASSGEVTLTVTAGSDTVDPVRTNNTAQTIVTVEAAPVVPVTTPVPTLTDIALLLLAAALGLSAVAVHRRGR
jgi:poly(3-hydroxybutyrate) depolymerase